MAEQWNQLTLSGQVRAELTLSRTGQPQDDTFRFAEPRNVGLESAVPFGIRLPEGVVFLPAAGRRYDSSSISNSGVSGNYWSSSTSTNGAYYMAFASGSIYPQMSTSRKYGYSVRLVTEVPAK